MHQPRRLRRQLDRVRDLHRRHRPYRRPIIGAVIFWLVNKFFADYATWYQLGLDVLAIAVTLLFRWGLWGWVQGKTGLTLFPTQRRLKVKL